VGDRAKLASLLRRPVPITLCLNIVEGQAAPMRLFYEQVISAAGASLELVRVPDELPPDLRETGTLSQHLLASPLKARDVLGWHATASPQVLRRAVGWHLSHSPGDADTDGTAPATRLRRPRSSGTSLATGR
jgi:nucleoside-diphosphate-sugar epimerase